MIQLVVGVIGGGIISWIIACLYYRKTNTNAPAWAFPLIEKLPLIAPSEEELLRLFQEQINAGLIKPHPVFSHVACPNCGAPISELQEKVYGDEATTILDLSCPNCGWSDWSEV